MTPKTQSILLGGVAIGVISSLLGAIPVVGGCIACLAYIGAGMLAVWHYTNENELTIRGGEGARMGALAAFVAGVISSAISFVYMKVAGISMLDEMRRGMEASGNSAQADQIMGVLSSPGVIAAILLFVLLIFVVLGAIGGAIGAAVFKAGGEEPGDSVDDLF